MPKVTYVAPLTTEVGFVVAGTHESRLITFSKTGTYTTSDEAEITELERLSLDAFQTVTWQDNQKDPEPEIPDPNLKEP